MDSIDRNIRIIEANIGVIGWNVLLLIAIKLLRAYDPALAESVGFPLGVVWVIGMLVTWLIGFHRERFVAAIGGR